MVPELRVTEVRGTGTYVRVSFPMDVPYEWKLPGAKALFYTHVEEEDDFSNKSIVVKTIGLGSVLRIIGKDVWFKVENPKVMRVKIGHCAKAMKGV